MQHKRCYRCKIEKSLIEFYRDRSKKDGFEARCKKCSSQQTKLFAYKNPNYWREWQKRNKEKIKEINRKSYRKRQAKCRAISLAYYYANSNKILETRKQQRLENPEKFRKKYKQWAQANPKQVLENSTFRKLAQIQRTPSWLTLAQRRQIQHFYKTCPAGFHVDHIVPLRGKVVSGLHVPWNLQCLPAALNQRKGNRI
jgi:hypothetical protein